MNIKAVAKFAGVSTATVSRTINEPTKASSKTAERVQHAIATLNPNIGAMGAISERGLRVSQDISVIGFDDIQTERVHSTYAQYSEPATGRD